MAWEYRFIIGFLFMLVITGIAMGADSDTVTIDINITQQLSIDVSPNSVSWAGLNIGETGRPEYFTVTNVGSVNITSLRANITNDNTNPYGTGNPSNYNAGEFILMNSTSAGFYYVNKKNWNESVPGEVTPPNDWTEGANTGYFGIIRTAWDNDVGQDYYFFTNKTSSSGNCLTGTANVLIGKYPKNVTSQGSVDFTDSSQYSTVSITAGGNGANTPTGHDLAGYCLLVSADCSTVTLARWNTDLDTYSNCTNDQVFFDGNSPNELEPGSSTWFWLEPKIPNGVPDGDVSQGTLTIIASAA